jgi:hypothetical protein
MQRTDAWPFKRASAGDTGNEQDNYRWLEKPDGMKYLDTLLQSNPLIKNLIANAPIINNNITTLYNTMKKTEKTLSEVHTSLKMWTEFLTPLNLQHMNERLEKLEASKSSEMENRLETLDMFQQSVKDRLEKLEASKSSNSLEEKHNTLKARVDDMQWVLVSDVFNTGIEQVVMMVGFYKSPLEDNSKQNPIASIQWGKYWIYNTTKNESKLNDGSKRMQKIVNIHMLQKNTHGTSMPQLHNLMITKVKGKYLAQSSFPGGGLWEYWITASGFQKRISIFVRQPDIEEFETATSEILKLDVYRGLPPRRHYHSQMNSLNV